MDYITVKDAVEKWGTPPRGLQVFWARGKIPGVVGFGVAGGILKDAGSLRTVDVIKKSQSRLMLYKINHV